MLTRRACGILLHPTSLAGPFGIGDLGPAARSFVDFLQHAGQRVWQTLPLGPTGYGDSPYSALSAFAGNPLLISPQDLVDAGDLEEADLRPWWRDTRQTDYPLAAASRASLLARGADRFFRRASPRRRQLFEDFCRCQAFWLDDYALFHALREQFDQRCWTDWPRQLRDREAGALLDARRNHEERIRFHCYCQFIFAEQWLRLKDYANQRGILMFGDMPIFVAQDSSDTWAGRHLFQLDPQGHPSLVAGVPPDYFSARGQRWGNPLFNWTAMAEEDFLWWRRRMLRTLELFDLVRIDHFRGFSACWAIPADAPDALSGCWQEAPGEALFGRLESELGKLPLVAEDLGVITPEVTGLRDRWGLPGMKILQFAFDSDHHHPYLPANHPANAVVYTGTHDNNTLLGWWEQLDPQQRARVCRLLGHRLDKIPADLISYALASPARLAMVPLQDLLGLGASARMNRPGTSGGNWIWRIPKDCLDENLAAWLRAETERTGRGDS